MRQFSSLDYSAWGGYFITVVTQKMRKVFGKLVNLFQKTSGNPVGESSYDEGIIRTPRALSNMPFYIAQPTSQIGNTLSTFTVVG